MVNHEIAGIFEEMSIMLDMKGVEFKPRAYEKAAMEIREYPYDLEELYGKEGLKGLDKIPTVGANMAQKIEEFIKTGRVKEYEKLKREFPVDIRGLSAVEGVGPKIIKELYKKLKIKNLKDLEAAAKKHKIRGLPHFGDKTEENILRGIDFLKQSGDRKILGYVLPLTQAIEERLKKIPGVKEVVTCGSVRRRQETIGDIDILAVSAKPEKVHDVFTAMPEVAAIYAKGERKSSVRLANGMDADLRVVPEESFGAALQYFTGDKTHNIVLRKRAIVKGMKLNEYGLYKGKKQIAGKNEKEIYETLGLDYVEPELRVNSGEIEAAAAHKLPKIIPYGSIRGDLQVQSHWSDGANAIQELADAAIALGREYIAITDHTHSLAMTGGLDEKRLAEQGKEIDLLNTKFKKNGKKFQILKSAEINILKDGTLDIDDAAVAKLDVVGGAVHTNLKMPKAEMTARIIKAMQHPYINVIFHPTGRLINRRPPYELDMKEIIRAAKKYNVALEIDAFPDRSDIRDEYVRMAVEAGVKLTISTDAHAIDHLRFIELGEAIARRGWAEKKDILNTLPVEKLLAYFKKKK